MPKDTKSQKNVYKHLSFTDREKIMLGIALNMKQNEIAKMIGKNPSTISRELKNNSIYCNNVYRAITAQWKSERRQRNSHSRERIPNKRIRNWIILKLKDMWSPEQIAGSIGFYIPWAKTNYETIYQFIYNERRDLIPYLARGHRIRIKRAQKYGNRRGTIPNRTMIDERPAIINERKRIGDWEGDTMVSRKSKQALAVLKERKIQYVKMGKLMQNNAEEMENFLIEKLLPLPKHICHSLTLDNGHENSNHELVSEKADVDIYFCNPYHSWEKGSVENTNGLIRRFFPKKTDFSLITDYEIMYVERALNKRPRKSLGFRTPAELYKIALGD